MREVLQVNMAFSSFPLSTLITLLLLVASIQSNSMYDDDEDPFQPVTSDETVAEGGTVTLTCRVPETDNSSLQWSNTAQQTLYFGAKRALRDNRIQLHKSTPTELSITISNVQLSDDGEYTCSIFTMPVRIARATVTVLGVPGKPVITGFEDPVQEGGAVTLTCTSTGSKPPALLYWYKGQEKLEARPNVVESNPNEPTYTVTSVLTLRVTRNDNNAMIGCAVDHPSITNGEKRTEKPLSVLFSPSVMIKPESDLPREGERFSLHCVGIGNPEPLSFIWQKKDAEFPPQVRPDGAFLRFEALNKSDNGVYLCHADNGIGWNEGSYTLQVQDLNDSNPMFSPFFPSTSPSDSLFSSLLHTHSPSFASQSIIQPFGETSTIVSSIIPTLSLLPSSTISFSSPSLNISSFLSPSSFPSSFNFSSTSSFLPSSLSLSTTPSSSLSPSTSLSSLVHTTTISNSLIPDLLPSLSSSSTPLISSPPSFTPPFITPSTVSWLNGVYITDPTAMSTSSGVDHAVIGGVVAVIVFIMLCLLIVLGRYLIRHKGTYLTHEAKGSDDAQDADTAIINAEGGHSGIEDKKEYFI
ncbi:cell adhesion molecule 3 isoform X3 [Tachysurus fulvidraco]|uniref:cell adhesion molecule 3 isoform X3 n=1 Tax=Tachysurus fulvidraco TaxID=1234273 RepID=UPI001FEE9D1D|nr:cell adhesion molecule 3 isoform X3 [Tachysurus fulvidraco]